MNRLQVASLTSVRYGEKLASGTAEVVVRLKELQQRSDRITKIIGPKVHRQKSCLHVKHLQPHAA